MFQHCAASGFSGLGSFGVSNAPVGSAVNAYYNAGTPFQWITPNAEFGFAFSLDPGTDARNALAAALGANRYNVRVIYGERGGPLEVSGSQGMDRRQAIDIRNEITDAAQKAGFSLGKVLFNVEAPGSPFRVGSPGSVSTWGDLTPVAPKNIFDELGVGFAGDPSFVGGSLKNIAIYAGIGLLVFALISSRK